ncbi:Uncharacterized conserved protein YdhG, YjbR/CyaY-like superfamily, DUF1801 family [Daejeonella rubra]|uniref:Uncharacterized conserved protein YdhG, YjbR/CyaY-like superfamily, DUF1801 family n=1 Tax=Daejeonella rubra TaxID=990371 RepID=A0A1G9Q8L8_9SPHI|nr:DUF1801 domain-containing protein [Daejeonella rubra]SDM07366.1 Uncharacterized conserved protein YdhG, YjbR/CyaY-like superfamily, DUF1801 family [Daejeonella rubra]
MKAKTLIPKDIDEYIALFPSNVQKTLQKLRTVINSAAPDSIEMINYQMPTFRLNGNLVHFAAYKNHIGFYPGPSGILTFYDELSAYELSKGTIRFPIDEELPYDLIIRIVKFRVKENLAKPQRK